MSYYRNGLYLAIVILFALFVLLLSGTLALEPIRDGFSIGSYQALSFIDEEPHSSEEQMDLNLDSTQPLPADEAVIAIALDSRKINPVKSVFSEIIGAGETILSSLFHPGDPTQDPKDDKPAITPPPKATNPPATITARPEFTPPPRSTGSTTASPSSSSRTATTSLFVTSTPGFKDSIITAPLSSSPVLRPISTTAASSSSLAEPSVLAPAPAPTSEGSSKSKSPHSEIAIAVEVGVAIFFFLSILAGTFFFLRRRRSAKKLARMPQDHEKSILAWTEATSDVYFPSTSRSTSPFSSVQDFGSSRAYSGYNYTPRSTTTHSKH